MDHSVNDGIDARLCSLSYVSVDDIAAALLRLGRGAKTDIKSAYRQVPVHPDDRHLLGLQWQGHYYIDTVLPFGLRSAPIIFSAIAEALEWIVCNRGVELIFHYIDDFIVLSPPQSEACERGLLSLVQTCATLGLIVADEKTEGPSTCLTVLGIEIDTVARSSGYQKKSSHGCTRCSICGMAKNLARVGILSPWLALSSTQAK